MTSSALVVEDQQELAELLVERLALDGFEATVATTGKSALDLCRERLYDVAFVDLKLPDMSGIATAAELKRQIPELRVILMTGFASSLGDPEISWAHVDGVLPKPWRPAELNAILRTLRRCEQ